ncbi:MAG: hypothetical protein IT350_01995 [Deltaproteobacteria bacterium]|nr:hypothetical protein [Deltaproteobacteria bacterium]
MLALLYRIVTGVVAIIALPFAALVVATRGSWRKGFCERLGFVPRCGRRDRVLVHMASVGEVITAAGLVASLSKRLGDQRLVLSCLTPTGYDELRRRFPDLETRFFPAEGGCIPTRWLSRLGISRAILLETELWPGFLLAARRMGISVAMVNGRISDRSFGRFRAARIVLKPLLRAYSLALTQNELYAERLRAIGMPSKRCLVTGNLKFEPPPVAETPVELAEALQAFIADRRAIVFASTHPGEEEIAMDVLARIRREEADVVGIFAPRHRERFDDVWNLLARLDPSGARRSAMPDDAASRSWLLLDTHGELAHVYAFARGAFMGGSLVAVGGHNMLEAARAGTPVATGPHMRNFAREMELLEGAGAAARAANGAELTEVLLRWLRRPDDAARAGEAGRRAVETARGSLALTMSHLEAAGFLGETPGRTEVNHP